MPSLRIMLRLAAAVVILSMVAVAPTPARAQESATEAALMGVRQVDAGDKHTCAVLDNGQVRCWGYNLFRAVGDGTTSLRNRPVPVLRPDGSGPLGNITQVSGGGNSTCARTAGGEVRCWGFNASGELGAGSPAAQNLPVAVVGTNGSGRLRGVTQVTVGWNHACALLTSGQVRCWGANTEGQLGDGTNDPSSRPRVVSDPAGTGRLSGVTQISAGLYLTCARLTNGRAACWGNNGNSQAGDGTTSDRNRPVIVRNPANSGALTGVVEVAAGRFHACARLSNRQVRCWGASPSGGSALPTAVLRGDGRPLGDVARLATGGGNHMCAGLRNGQVRCWGSNADGQLGNRTTALSFAPTAMVNAAGTDPIRGVTVVTVGEFHSCVRLSSGQAQCVGDNANSALGSGPGGDADRPVGVLA